MTRKRDRLAVICFRVPRRVKEAVAAKAAKLGVRPSRLVRGILEEESRRIARKKKENP